MCVIHHLKHSFSAFNLSPTHHISGFLLAVLVNDATGPHPMALHYVGNKKSVPLANISQLLPVGIRAGEDPLSASYKRATLSEEFQHFNGEDLHYDFGT